MKKCPFVGLCGGCSFDFSDEKYKSQKQAVLPKLNFTEQPIWGTPGTRRRAEFAFVDNHFGFYKHGTKDIIDIDYCPNVLPEINNIIQSVGNLPWVGAGSALITVCENGIDVAVNANMPYCGTDFKNSVDKLPPQIIRFTWNGNVLRKYAMPQIRFDDVVVDYPTNAFLQPTVDTEKSLRDLVVKYVSGAKRVADLFCGIGNFTFATHAVGFDVFGNGVERDLFENPLRAKNLNQYDVVIMDPPRAGALKQSKELSKSDVKKIIYVSCNPNSFIRDKIILENAGYKSTVLIPVDQFVGSNHWEIFGVFEK